MESEEMIESETSVKKKTPPKKSPKSRAGNRKGGKSKDKDKKGIRKSKSSKSNKGKNDDDEVKGCLMDIFGKQLVIIHSVSQPTQTDWEWKKMALRWRHAKVMLASFLNEADLYPKEPYELGLMRLQMLCDKFPDFCKELTPEKKSALMAALSALPRSDFDAQLAFPSQSVSNILSYLSTNRLVADDMFSEFLPSSESGSQVSETTFVSYPHKRKSRVESVAANRASVLTAELLKKGHQTEEEKRRLVELVQERFDKRRRVSFLISENDKCEDTSDLLFDPFHPDLHYTQKDSNVQPLYLPPGSEELVEEKKHLWTQTGHFVPQ